MPARRGFARINRPACRYTLGDEGLDEGVVVIREEAVVIVIADVFNARARHRVVGELRVTTVIAPAIVAGGRRLFDDFFNHLRLLMMAKQAADALRQQHATGHTGCRL